jgi:hypothetical protein
MSRVVCFSFVPEIELGYYGLNENDRFTFRGILYTPAAEGTVADAISFLQKTYSNTMSAEFSYLEVYVLQLVKKTKIAAIGIRRADHATLYPLKFGTNFADKRWSPGRYSSLAD